MQVLLFNLTSLELMCGSPAPARCSLASVHARSGRIEHQEEVVDSVLLSETEVDKSVPPPLLSSPPAPTLVRACVRACVCHVKAERH